MILLAATAVGLSGSGAYWFFTTEGDPLTWSEIVQWCDTFEGAISFASTVLESMPPVLAAWSAALLALRLRRPRARPALLRRQPGAIACLVATISVLSTYAFTTFSFYNQTPWVQFSPMYLVPAPVPVAGSAVLSAWLWLAVCRGCRPEPSWIDRAGRVLGLIWVASGVSVIWLLFVGHNL